jgi:peptidoglycan/LPS O-acetylase OafA/YrhL
VASPAFRGYIAEFDGVRAIGIIAVILHHMWPWESLSRRLFLVVQLPWMLMDTFFVISGFLITGILLDTRARPDYFKSFYVRRALRILPLYYVVLSFITATTVFNGHAAYRDMLAHWGSPWWFFVYLGNIPTALAGHEPMAGGGSFIPLWSLQIEEQFYLLFPILVRRLRLGQLTQVLVGLCCFSTLLRLFLYWRFPGNEMVQYEFLPCRMEGLALGAWMAVRFRQGSWIIDKRKLSAMTVFWAVLAVGAAVLGGYFYTTPFNRTVGFLLSPIFSACGVLWIIAFRSTPATGWLRQRWLVYIGKISYAAYLIHWPVGNILTVLATRFGAAALNTGALRLIMIYLMTFGLSALSWHFLEQPCLRLKDALFPVERAVRPA